MGMSGAKLAGQSSYHDGSQLDRSGKGDLNDQLLVHVRLGKLSIIHTVVPCFDACFRGTTGFDVTAGDLIQSDLRHVHPVSVFLMKERQAHSLTEPE